MTPIEQLKQMQTQICELAQKNKIGIACVIIEPEDDGQVHTKWVGSRRELCMCLIAVAQDVILKEPK